MRLIQQLETQRQILVAQNDGRECSRQCNGKASKPRSFWIMAGDQIAFTPRFGSDFLFEGGQSVLVANLGELAEVRADFRSAAEAGVLDAELMEKIRAQNASSVTAEPKRRRWPRKQAAK